MSGGATRRCDPEPHEDHVDARKHVDRRVVVPVDLEVGFGRVVVSEMEAPNMIAILVWSE